MKKIWQITRRHGLKLLILAVLIYYAVRHVQYDELKHAFTEVSWLFVLLAIFANLASIMLKVASWKIIFDASFQGIKGRWHDLTSALMIGFLFNALVPARAGEVARAYVISRREALRGHQLSRSTVFGTIVLERVFDGAAMALIVIFGIVRMDLPDWAITGAIILLVLCGVGGAVLIVLEAKRERLKETAELARNRHSEHHPWWRKQMTRLHGALARFSEGQKALRRPGRVTAVFATTIFSWLSQLLAVYLSLHAFHNPDTGNSLAGDIGILGALLLLILINVAGALPATPGNVGIFQLATVIPLTVTYGIPETTALAFSIGLQVIEGSIGLGVGSAFLLREGLTFDQVKRESIKELGENESGS